MKKSLLTGLFLMLALPLFGQSKIDSSMKDSTLEATPSGETKKQRIMGEKAQKQTTTKTKKTSIEQKMEETPSHDTSVGPDSSTQFKKLEELEKQKTETESLNP